MKSGVLFYLVYIVLNLHLLRNVSAAIYLIVLSLLYIPVVLYCLAGFSRIKVKKIGGWSLLFLFSGVGAAITTVAYHGLTAGMYASGRYFLCFPMIFAAYFLLPDQKSVRNLFWMFCIITVFGLLTIPLQFVTGPIDWFAEPGSRANTIRYASLLGSLPTAGGVIPFVIFIILSMEIKYYIKAAFGLVYTICAVLTLQKAALLGIPLAIGIYLLYAPKRQMFRFKIDFTKIVVAVTVVLCLVWALSPLIEESIIWKNATAYAYASFNLGEGQDALGGDVTMKQSLLDRLGTLPRYSLENLYHFAGEWGYLVGGGFGMVGVALLPSGDALETVYTAHNGYVDFVLIGGYIHLLAFLGLTYALLNTLFSWLKFCRKRGLDDQIPRICVGLLTIALVSLFFAGSLTFQPITASLFWSMVGIAWKYETNHSIDNCEIAP